MTLSSTGSSTTAATWTGGSSTGGASATAGSNAGSGSGAGSTGFGGSGSRILEIGGRMEQGRFPNSVFGFLLGAFGFSSINESVSITFGAGFSTTVFSAFSIFSALSAFFFSTASALAFAAAVFPTAALAVPAFGVALAVLSSAFAVV